MPAVRSTSTGRPLSDPRAIRRAVARRTAPRPMPPVPGSGGQAQSNGKRMVGRRGADMRSSRKSLPSTPQNKVGRKAYAARTGKPTGGRVDGASVAGPGEYRLSKNARKRRERQNARVRSRQMR